MNSFEPPRSILIIGIAGGLAQILAQLLSKAYPKCQLIGVDSRSLTKIDLPQLKIITMRYSRGNFEKIFRDYDFDIVYHLGRVSHVSGSHLTLAKRLDLNLMGTSRVLDLCLKHSIKKIIILSTFHVYGALPDNPVFLKEDAILRASINFPELRDVVEMDQISTNWMWKNQNKISTVVLRPCNIIGAKIKNAISKYLLSKWTPSPLDFNPMFQFIHEFDMANVLKRSIEDLPTGIYNVAPHDFISLAEARKEVGVKGLPSSLFVISNLAKFIKYFDSQIPDYLFEYLKYSAMIDPNEIQLLLGKDYCRFTTKEALQLLRLS